MNSILTPNEKVKPEHLLYLFVTIIVLVVCKDFMHSLIKNYSFYLSESLLFGTFWILFIPLIVSNRIRFNLRPYTIGSVLINSIIHLSLFSLVVYGVSTICFAHTFGFIDTLIESLTENGMTCLLIYGTDFFVSSRKEQQLKLVKSESQVVDTIFVKHHNKTILLNKKDIIYIKSEKPYIALMTNDRKYLFKSSLKKFLTEESTQSFIQIHKGVIINTNYIKAYSSRKNGDFDVELANEHIVRASRSFKNNFKPFFD